MSPLHVKVGGVWKQAASVHTKVGGVWKTAVDMPVRVGGAWKSGILAESSDFEHIQTITVGAGGAASVTFSSIPQTYKHLQIRGIARDSQPSGFNNAVLTFDGDTAANYSGHRLDGNGATASSVGYANTSNVNMAFYLPSAGIAANVFSASIIDILDYSSTSKNKTVRSLTGSDGNGSGVIVLSSGNWRSLSSVTSISLSSGWALQQYSEFRLYGVKG